MQQYITEHACQTSPKTEEEKLLDFVCQPLLVFPGPQVLYDHFNVLNCSICRNRASCCCVMSESSHLLFATVHYRYTGVSAVGNYCLFLLSDWARANVTSSVLLFFLYALQLSLPCFDVFPRHCFYLASRPSARLSPLTSRF
jgi:hypothetical protein